MDEKFFALCQLVREARLAEKAAFARMEEARIAWKAANEILTDRQKVLDGYVAARVAEETGLKAEAA